MTDIRTNPELGRSNAAAEHASKCRPAPKWAVVLGDRLFPMPRRTLAARDILDQSGVGRDSVLIRDHGGTDDVVFPDEALVDLARGNVFKVAPRCEPAPQPACASPAKLAFVCDDEWKVTLVSRQTGRSLKRLLNLPDDAMLLRDFESPHDEAVGDEAVVEFGDGAVFTCKNGHAPGTVRIIVNGREKTVEGRTISYAGVVTLAFVAVDHNTLYTVTFKHGPPSRPEGKLVAGDDVKIQCGMHFHVTSTCKS
jgi:hypothetical protein